MERLIIHTKNCIAEIANYLLYVMALFLIFLYIKIDRPGFFQFVVLAIVPLYFYLLRCTVHRVWIFVLLHFVPLYFIWVIYSANIIYMVLFLAAAAVQGGISVGTTYNAREKGRWDGGNKTFMPTAVIGTGAVIYFITADTILIALIVIFIVLYFINLHLAKFTEYIEINRLSTGNVPNRSIFFSGVVLVGFFILLSLLLMLGATVWHRQTGFDRWNVDTQPRFDMVFDHHDPVEDIPKDLPDYDHLGGIDSTEYDSYENSIIASIVNIFFTAVSFFILGGLFIWIVLLLISFFRSWTNKFDYRNNMGEDDDIVEKLEWTRKKKDRQGFKLFLTTDEKIRRIFAKTVNKHLGRKPIVSSSTAREILEFFGNSESAVLLVELYEKARYAKGTSTETDVKEAKRLSKVVGILPNP